MSIPPMDQIMFIIKKDEFVKVIFWSGENTGQLLMDDEKIYYYGITNYNETTYYEMNEELKEKIKNKIRLKTLLNDYPESYSEDEDITVLQHIKQKKPFFFSQHTVKGHCIAWCKGNKLKNHLKHILNIKDEGYNYGELLKYGDYFKNYLEQNNHPYYDINGQFTYEDKTFVISNITYDKQNGEYIVNCNAVDPGESELILFKLDENYDIHSVHHYNFKMENKIPDIKLYDVVPLIQEFVKTVM